MTCMIGTPEMDKALEEDGEKLRQLTGEDHGPWKTEENDVSRYDPDNLPEYNEALMCSNCQEKSDVIVGLYGMFGGGEGPYTMCADCGQIVSKSFESNEHKIIDSTAEEVQQNAQVTDNKD